MSIKPDRKQVQITSAEGSGPLGMNVISGSRRHVLLVEDSPVTQDLLAILLKNMGVELSIAGNGVDAIALLARESFDLVLMDCQMPQLDGFEATRQLRAQGVKTPIIALTAYTRGEDEQKCLDAGMDDFMGKPFRQSELIEVLRKWLGSDIFGATLTGEPGVSR